MPRREIVNGTMVADTLILASGDVITDSLLVVPAAPNRSARGTIRSIIVNDEDDQGAALDVVLFSANVSLGTKNSAPAISDADARNVLAIVSIAAADFIDLGGVRVASKLGLDIPVVTDTLYVSMICRSGTPTYTASGLRVRLGIEYAD